MKITYLELENFEAIKYCMNSSRIWIDFTKAQNKVCLFIGPNGSGKTFILSLLNPFSTLGNLDVRDGYNLIIPHKNGKKIVHIVHNNELYEITHFYTASKDTHTTKSFITRNGVELNPNGNVTSFKELVKDELGIVLEYMKLIRLGPNVKSLISLSSTERKVFMGKLLDDIGVYLEYYKHVNNNMRSLKEMLAHVVDKLKKTKFHTKDEYKKAIKQLEAEIEEIEHDLDSYKMELAVKTSKQQELGDILDLKRDLEKYGKEFKKMNKTREKLGNDTKPASYYRERYEEACKDLSSKENLLETTEILYKRELETRDSLEQRVRRLDIQLSKENEVDHEIARLEALLSSCKKSIKERRELLEDFTSDISLDKFESFLSFLKASEMSVRDLRDFGQRPMKQIVSLLRQKKNVLRYVNSGILDAQDDDQTDVLLERLKNITGNPPCGDSECVGQKMYMMVQRLLADREVDEKMDVSFYHDVEMVYQGLNPILEGFKPFASVIDQFPDDIKKGFTIDSILTRLEKEDSLYDIKKMNRFYSLLKERDDLLRLEEQKEDLKKEISRIERFSRDVELSEEYELANTDLEKSKAQLSKYKQDKHQLESDIHELTMTAEAMEDAMNMCEHFEEVRDKLADLQKSYSTYHDLSAECHNITETIIRIEESLRTKRNELGVLNADYTSFKELNKNLKAYETHYDNMDFMKRSLSSSKDGIPTVIIKHYLQDVADVTNDLLDVAFGNEVQIKKFEITADSFTIPVYVNNKLLPDVKLTSQGQVALITVALAFALVNQSLHGYNILALDEIDGPLDQENRRKFIAILENQIDRIGAEQIFMITHNDMFSHYPVDIIDLTGQNNRDTYKLANFLQIEKE